MEQTMNSIQIGSLIIQSTDKNESIRDLAELCHEMLSKPAISKAVGIKPKQNKSKTPDYT